MADSLRDLVVSLSLNTDNFTRNIKSVNKQIQEAESYFKLASAGVQGFDSSTAGLSSKLEMLERKLSLQKDAVGQYEKALQAASEKLTEYYNRQQDYSSRLADAKAKQNVYYRFCDTDDPDLSLILDSFGINIPRKCFKISEVKQLKAKMKMSV